MPPTRSRHTRHVVAILAAASVALLGCGDDDDGGDDPTTSTTEAVDSTISTMAPETTSDLGNETVPGDDPNDTGATDTTVSGAVPGQSDDQLDPPDEAPGGPSPGG